MSRDEQSTPAMLATVEIDGLRAISSAEIDSQIATARRFPRDSARSLATIRRHLESDSALAESCFYRLPRKGSEPVEGCSIRMAELLLGFWGNTRATTRLVSVGERQVVVEGVFIDLENNTAVREEVVGSIWGRSGRYGEDMIRVTIQATASKALRNVVLRGIPRVLWQGLIDTARKSVSGKITDLARGRAEAVKWYALQGIHEERLLAALGLSSVDGITAEMLADLRANAKAAKDGDLDIHRAYPPIETEEAEASEKPEPAEKAKEGPPASSDGAERRALMSRLASLRVQEMAAVKAIGGAVETGSIARMTTDDLRDAVAAVESQIAPKGDEPTGGAE